VVVRAVIALMLMLRMKYSKENLGTNSEKG